MDINKGLVNLSDKALLKLYSAANALEIANAKEQVLRKEIKRLMKAKGISFRNLAIETGIDASNLSKLITGRRSNLNRIENICNIINDL